VPRDLIVNAEYDWIRFTGQLSDPKRTFLSLKANVGDVDDLGFHVPYRIRKRANDTSRPLFASSFHTGKNVPRYRQSVTTSDMSYDESSSVFASPSFGFRVARRHAMAKQKVRMAVTHKTVNIDGLDIFYREAGSAENPTVLLLHGFPTSSQMFRTLMPELANGYHLVAPDYPGFGESSSPPVDQFEYTFDNLTNIVEKFTEALKLERYSLYVMDYGAPVGYRLAVKHPERVQALIVQNGNAYEEGLRDFWIPLKAYWKDRSEQNAKPLKNFLTYEATKSQYTSGVRNVEVISPDTWTADQYRMDRPGNKEIQLKLFYSYGSNPPLYREWQAYFRNHQPPTLIVWGKNDPIFPAEGAEPYKRDLKNLEFHLLDTGHFALEEDGGEIARYMESFLDKQIKRPRTAA
jgi:pimeloyl-ACP methyl ester carboxylesterase